MILFSLLLTGVVLGLACGLTAWLLDHLGWSDVFTGTLFLAGVVLTGLFLPPFLVAVIM